MIEDAGVRISLQDDVSSGARRVSEELDHITRSADGINQALDPRTLDEYNNKLNQIGQNYSRVFGSGGSASGGQGIQQTIANAGQGLGSAVTQAGSGNVGGGVLSGAQGLTGLLSGLGPIAGALTAVIGIGLVTNKLADLYSAREAPSRRLAGMQGMFGFDIEENSERLREVMARTTEQVAEYGHTYEAGTRAVEGFLLAGGTNFGTTRAAQYSAAYGVDFTQAAALEGLGQRFGQSRGLQSTRALIRSQDLAPAMFGEMMQGLQESFETSLSFGIVRGFEEIARSQQYFSGAGATWTGAMGQQRVAQMDAALRNATGLGSESDVFMYRAASALSGGDLLGTRRIMEGGMTPELFQGVREQLSRYGYGRTESVLQLSRMFGLSTTAAEQLFDMQGMDEAAFQRTMAEDLGANVGKTTETEYLGAIERIKQGIGGQLGAGAYDIRADIVGFGEDIIQKITDWLPDAEEQEANIATMNATIENADIVLAEQGNAEYRRTAYEQLRNTLTVQAGAGLEEAEGILGLLNRGEAAGAQTTELGRIAALYDEATGRRSEGGRAITAGELSNMEALLQEIIDAIHEPTYFDAPTADHRSGRGLTE